MVHSAFMLGLTCQAREGLLWQLTTHVMWRVLVVVWKLPCHVSLLVLRGCLGRNVASSHLMDQVRAGVGFSCLEEGSSEHSSVYAT